MERIIEICERNISSLEVIATNKNDFNELEIINDSINNLNICKELYRDF